MDARVSQLPVGEILLCYLLRLQEETYGLYNCKFYEKIVLQQRVDDRLEGFRGKYIIHHDIYDFNDS